MTRKDNDPGDPVDLDACDREPIHIPGSIQPHGVLLVLAGPSLRVDRASRNLGERLGRPVAELLGRTLTDLLGPAQVDPLRAALESPSIEGNPLLIGHVVLRDDRGYLAVAHRHAGSLILELEESDGPMPGPDRAYTALPAFLARLDATTSVEDLSAQTAAEVRRITGFDRVLVYRFDADGHGTVIAEDRNDNLPSYLHHRFPASDIPRQARKLYCLNRVRQIADAGYAPVPLVSAGPTDPLDLSYSILRSVSPVHLEYMRNMGTAASMSVSVLREGELWGLISCHHRDPRRVPLPTRTACDFLAQVLALQVGTRTHQAGYEHRLRLSELQTRLIASLTAQDDFVAGLTGHVDELLLFARAAGVAILFGGVCTRLGQTPGEDDVRRLAGWLTAEDHGEVFATDSLAREVAWAAPLRDTASGLLAISISQIHSSYILWFRPEIVRSVLWAGNPYKPTKPPDPSGEQGPPVRLSPRQSFEDWKEVVRDRSEPWDEAEIRAAHGLRSAIVGIVLRKAEELAALNQELRRSNQELEAFSYSVSHDLRAPFRHIVGYAELLRERESERLDGTARRYVDTIVESAKYAGNLVDNLLNFSQMSRSSLHPVSFDMAELVREVISGFAGDSEGRQVEWQVGELPAAFGDVIFLRQVWANLLANALKYTRPRPVAVVEVAGTEGETENVYLVRDNGIGFDMAYVDKLFGVFQRLHRMEDFEGTGIGLANVRRIVTRHGGRAWADGAVDQGATFYFTLPRPGAGQ